MATRSILFALCVVAAAAVQAATAMDMVVGGDKGWTLGVNYTEWAAGMPFYVGDSLVFNYDTAKHNVLSVSGDDFRACSNKSPLKSFASGKDVIKLATSGKKWYICGKADHCTQGLKMVINVQEAPAPAPTPTRTSSAVRPAAGLLSAGIAFVVAAVFQ